MLDDKSAGRWRAFIAVSAVLVLMGLAYILYDLYTVHIGVFNIARAHRELAEAVMRWESRGIHDYRISVQGFVPLNCLIDGELTVRDDQLDSVLMRENPLIEESQLVPVDRSRWESPGCPYEELTILRMFDRVRSDLSDPRNLGMDLIVRFDGRMGFITEYRQDRSNLVGGPGGMVSECCTWFEFSAFSELVR